MSTGKHPYLGTEGDAPDVGYDHAHWQATPDDWTEAEQREYKLLQRLAHNDILARAGGLGPALIGRPLAHLAAQIRKVNPDGSLGSALLDPDFDRKQLAERGLRREADGRIVPLDRTPNAPAASGAANQGQQEPPAGSGSNTPEGPFDPTNLDDPRNPWMYVTLSGAKQLAMIAELSHKPRILRRELIAQLQEAGVVPPPVPTDLAGDEDDEETD